jgi:hypothetical protein
VAVYPDLADPPVAGRFVMDGSFAGTASTGSAGWLLLGLFHVREGTAKGVLRGVLSRCTHLDFLRLPCTVEQPKCVLTSTVSLYGMEEVRGSIPLSSTPFPQVRRTCEVGEAARFQALAGFRGECTDGVAASPGLPDTYKGGI